jgi:hypothetical protein
MDLDASLSPARAALGSWSQLINVNQLINISMDLDASLSLRPGWHWDHGAS